MGMFAKGLVKGLAGSIDQNLQLAMSRRQEDVSRAKSFWMTRQAQKLDAADEHDRMAEKHLNRLINEFGGDVAKGLAAYKAIGGDVDTVGQYIKDLDATRQVNIKYNIADKFKFDGIDLSQFADLSKKDALSAVSMELKPLDIQYTDTSGLAKLGLGFKDKGKEISASINQLIPARDLSQIRNVTSSLRGKFDPSGLKPGVEFDMALQSHAATMRANEPSLQKQLARNVADILKAKNPEEKTKLLSDQVIILEGIRNYNKLTKTTNVIGTGTLYSAYSGGYKQLMTSSGYENTKGMITLTDPAGGPILEDQDALDAWSKIEKDYNTEFIKNNLLTTDGKAFKNDQTEAVASLIGVSELAQSLIATANETIDDEGGSDGTETSKNQLGVPKEVKEPVEGMAKFTPTYVGDPANNYANAQEFLAFAESAKNDPNSPYFGLDLTYDVAVNSLTTRFGLPKEVAERLAQPYKSSLEDIVAKRSENNEELIKALKEIYGDEIKDDGSVDPKPRDMGGIYAGYFDQKKADEWEEKFGATHNPDGKLKTFK